MADPRPNALYPRQSDALIDNWRNGTMPETLSAYNEPWYRALPNYLTGLVHGPDSTMAQANTMRHLAGTENPLNLPGQFSEGLNTAAQGYRLGDPVMTGLGALGAASVLPIPGFKGVGQVAKQEARPAANALMHQETGRPRVAALPPLGAQQESKVSWPLAEGSASTVRLSSVPNWLDRMGVPYERESSKSISDNFGPSLSSYFHIETPSGKKTIRVSDHDYLVPEGGLDFRLGSSADEAIAELHRLVGRDVPDDVAGRLSVAKAAKETADRLKDADRWRSTKPGFREQVEAWLKSNGAEYLLENPSAAWAAAQAHRYQSKESRAHALQEVIEKFKPTDAPPNALMPQEAKGITAYHGSPHDFDRFSMDKIGTGEGAQAYGHGLYFADNEGVAKSYRDKLSDLPELDKKKLDFTKKDSHLAAAIDVYGNDRQRIAEYIRQAANGDVEGLLTGKKYLLRSEKSRVITAAKNALADIESGAPLKPMLDYAGLPPAGKMYEVKINADPEHFLDWDKRLADQPHVLSKLAEYEKQIDNLGLADVYKDFKDASAMRGMPGEWFMRTASNGDKRALPNLSNDLREAGIPGIKYLDQGSRTAGEGSRNYVVFDEKLIEIMRKYGLLPPVAAAGAAGAAQAPNALYDGINQ